MPDLINKLSTYAALVGVIGAIGGGFYAWGEFNTRLNVVENVSYESVDLTNIHDRITAGDKETMEAFRSLAQALEILKADVAINNKAIEFNSVKIEEVDVKNSNPLGG
tara:strand:- start:3815 stop:4138 length:324 start_codon:yes stop_codon:yes gene_type:complete